MKLRLSLVCLVFMSISAGAHPVSFQGSKGLMGFHSPQLSHNQLNYSFRYWFGVGAHHFTRPNIKNSHASFASTNFLLKRWNESNLQANIYAVLGAGQSELGGSAESAGLGVFQFDIEDRDYYFLAKHSHIATEKRTDFNQSVIRVGLTPYVEAAGGIHSWFILEWQQSEFFDSTSSDLTPFLRIFHKNLLFEIGQSFNGSTKFNYISHF